MVETTTTATANEKDVDRNIFADLRSFSIFQSNPWFEDHFRAIRNLIGILCIEWLMAIFKSVWSIITEMSFDWTHLLAEGNERWQNWASISCIECSNFILNAYIRSMKKSGAFYLSCQVNVAPLRTTRNQLIQSFVQMRKLNDKCMRPKQLCNNNYPLHDFSLSCPAAAVSSCAFDRCAQYENRDGKCLSVWVDSFVSFIIACTVVHTIVVVNIVQWTINLI